MMPKYVMENEAIEGKKIFCVFEKRPLYGKEEKSKRSNVSITGNPAVAVVKQVWEYKKK
ncbi:MAG: hypothetical protein NWF04_07690 [Candidatus Bathyarchaeota archaeon]|nr:hypothetical protein [Candidatus Bathyarchaeota archaeon]